MRKPTAEQFERSLKIKKMRDGGMSCAKIGKLFNISGGRIEQILRRHPAWVKVMTG